ncbi:MAG: type II secretion system F family protein [Pseudomonadota bacterium]
MAAFAYKAVDKQGSNSTGVIEAASAATARADLRARGLLPLSVEATRGGPRRSGQIPRNALVLITRQLATLVGAGVRIEDALRTVSEEAETPKVAALVLTLRAAVTEGQSFAEALEAHEATFDGYYRASVRAGEASGRLGEVLDKLADFTEARAKNRQKVQFAMLYPALLALVSIGVVIALLVFVVPDIVRAFETRGAELPLLTRALIAASDWIAVFGPYALGGIVLAALGVSLAMKREAVRRPVHRLLADRRPFRGLTRRINATQFAGTLATLIVSRVPLVEALRAASSSISNLHMRAAAQDVARKVEEGAALSASMREARIFPPLLVAVVASGEQGGTLGVSLARAADDQARDLDALVSAIVALVEPAVLLVMGLVVLLLVMAILLPITNLNTLAI